jgi:iron(III) transport system substrate-binding protein
VIVYNRDAVKREDAPLDWDDVLDAKWRDKVLIRNPNPSDTMRAIFGAIIWRSYKDTNSPAAGYDWLRRLDANVHEYTADGTLLMQKIARREGLISLWDLPDVRLYQEQNICPSRMSFLRAARPLSQTASPFCAARRTKRKHAALRIRHHSRKPYARREKLLPHSRSHRP